MPYTLKIMHLPTPLNAFVTRAQVNHPVIAGKIIRSLTGSGSKSSAHSENSVRPASSSPARTNGIEAAKTAAGVPTAF